MKTLYLTVTLLLACVCARAAIYQNAYTTNNQPVADSYVNALLSGVTVNAAYGTAYQGGGYVAPFGFPVVDSLGHFTGFIPTNGIGQLPANVVTNGGALQLASRYNIPLPYAWYSGDKMTNTDGSIVLTIPDLTGNPSNTLYQYSFLGTVTKLNATIMNGLPAFGMSSGYGAYLTNATMFNGVPPTNWTMFIVYRDNLQGSAPSGSYLLWAGTTAFARTISFSPYVQSTVVGGGQGGACSFWGSDQGAFGSTAAGYTYDSGGGAVEISAIRAGGTSGGVSYWANGVLANRWESGVDPGLSLTGGLYLGGAPLLLSSLWWPGWIGEVLVYTNTLSDYDIQNVHAYLQTKYWGARKKTVVLAGDSVTIGAAAMANSNMCNVVQQYLGPSYQVAVNGYSGRTAYQIYTNLYTAMNGGRLPFGSSVIMLAGFNDTNVVSVTNFIIVSSLMCKTNGVNFGIATHYSTLREEVTYPGYRTNLNNWIYSNAPAIGAFIVDLSADPRIGPLGSYTNGAWILQTNSSAQVDQLHIATNSYPQIIAPLYGNAILALNQSSNSVQSVGGTITGTFTGSFTGNGSGVTNIPPTAIATNGPTVGSLLVSPDGTNGMWSQKMTYSGVTGTVTASNFNATGAGFTGNGGGLTNLSVSSFYIPIATLAVNNTALGAGYSFFQDGVSLSVTMARGSQGFEANVTNVQASINYSEPSALGVGTNLWIGVFTNGVWDADVVYQIVGTSSIQAFITNVVFPTSIIPGGGTNNFCLVVSNSAGTSTASKYITAKFRKALK